MHLYFCCGKLSVVVEQTPTIPVRMDNVEYIIPSKALGLVSYAFHEDLQGGWFAIECMFEWGTCLVICLVCDVLL